MKKVMAKIGTHSQCTVCLKDGTPKKGEHVEFKTDPYQKWQRGIVDEVKDLGYPLYYISLL